MLKTFASKLEFLMKKLAIVQVPPIFLNLPQSIERASELINEAAKSGADLVMFPEAYLPGYPSWVWRLRPGGDMGKSKAKPSPGYRVFS